MATRHVDSAVKSRVLAQKKRASMVKRGLKRVHLMNGNNGNAQNVAPTFRPKEMAERNAAKTVEQRIQHRTNAIPTGHSSARIHFAARNSTLQESAGSVVKVQERSQHHRNAVNTVLDHAIIAAASSMDS